MQIEPSQSSLRDASSPEGGASWLLPVSTNKAPPSGELANKVSLRGFILWHNGTVSGQSAKLAVLTEGAHAKKAVHPLFQRMHGFGGLCVYFTVW